MAADDLPTAAGAPGLLAPVLLFLVALPDHAGIGSGATAATWCSMQRCGNSTKAAKHRRHPEENVGSPVT
ncbi:CGNR zinc finger domain-containing protein [Streptomyces mirabilis]|uniref:CGNR zinc finger domain-containing protein n=1 Tax=Streptomyces mirabilis TaxID=68239 RepID=UPI003711286C